MSLRVFRSSSGEFIFGVLIDFDDGSGRPKEEKESLLSSIRLVDVASFVMETPLALGRAPTGNFGLMPVVPWVKVDDTPHIRFNRTAVAFEVENLEDSLHSGMLADYRQATSKIQLVSSNVGNPSVGFPFGRGMPT